MQSPTIWMPIFIGEYLAETMHLTARQHGAYLLLLLACWRKGGALPDDEERLATIARLKPEEWQKDGPVLAQFFVIEDGKWRHERLSEELAKATDNQQKRSIAGSKSAAKRQQKSNPSPSPSPSSEAKASGDDDDNVAAVIFRQGLEWLGRSSGKPEPGCRALLGKWRKSLGSDAALIELLGRAQREGVIEPVGWIEKAIARRQYDDDGPSQKPRWN